MALHHRFEELPIAPVVMTLRVLSFFAFAPVAPPWADGVVPRFADMWRILKERMQVQAATLFFQLFSRRYECGPMILTSN